MKGGHGGQVVSSLFRYNLDIPKVVSSKVTELKEDVFSSDSFSHLSLHPFMVHALEERLQLTQMTAVQQRAIPTILQGQDALIKSQTGSECASRPGLAKQVSFRLILQPRQIQWSPTPDSRQVGEKVCKLIQYLRMIQYCQELLLHQNHGSSNVGLFRQQLMRKWL
ncbi:uncharacterized protein LOC124261895 [Haliotis rubra]|uniref:uncharacterized protein LOC124261895 n=1 Tax=Haliotis rubra TaxID=36100 RepID=UPI001EE4F228|nr:uncharacterized protein LOC124261895 [Haliotis rubra]